ncbi:MAG: retroviral-like aspartic protease [Chloroflexota bacterium]
MAQSVRFSYTAAEHAPISLMPRLTLTLSYQDRSVDVVGLLDTGASVNILPYSLGQAIGAVWDEQTTPVPLTGSLGRLEARALVVSASHPQLMPDAPVRLVFAWTLAEDVPVAFGQVNFFMEFDVCFFRAQAQFEVRLKSAGIGRGQPATTAR